MSAPIDPVEARRRICDALVAAYEVETGHVLPPEMRALLELIEPQPPPPPVRRRRRWSKR